MMWLDAFVGKLAYQEKHSATASETTVSTWTKVFYWFWFVSTKVKTAIPKKPL
jgi:hypothetical protein